MELISREDTLKIIVPEIIKARRNGKTVVAEITNGILSTLYDSVSGLPIIERRPKGKWIHDGLNFPYGVDWTHCSVCGRKGINVPADLTNFCPDCGADMRGEE